MSTMEDQWLDFAELLPRCNSKLYREASDALLQAHNVVSDIRQRLQGMPESRLDGDGGLVEAVMRIYRAVENSNVNFAPCVRCGKPMIWQEICLCRSCVESQLTDSRTGTEESQQPVIVFGDPIELDNPTDRE